MAENVRELLIQRGAASPEAVVRAEAEAARTGRTLPGQLLAAGAADERALAAVLAEAHGMPGVDLSRSAVATSVLELVPRPVAETDRILPLSTEGGRLHLAVASPADAERVLPEVRFVTGMEVSVYLAVDESLRRAIAGAYEAAARGDAEWRGFAASGRAGEIAVVLPGDLPMPEGDEVIEIAD